MTGSDAAQTRPSRRRLPGGRGLAFVVVIVAAVAVAFGLLTYVRSGDSEVLADGFEGPDAPLEASVAIPWTVVSGAFEQRNGAAGATADGALPAIALAAAPSPDGQIGVRIRHATSGSGVLFRYADQSHYWLVVHAPEFATWNVVKVLDGQPHVMANTGAFSPSSAELAVRMEAESIRVYIDGALAAMVSDPAFALATAMGLYVGVADAASDERVGFEAFGFDRIE